MKTNVLEYVCQEQDSSNRAAVETAVTVKLGLDVHAADIVVCRQDGGQLPKPSRRLSWDQLLRFAQELAASGARVVSCYEAGPTGYGLHRRLESLGVRNLVVVPQRWSRDGARVKTDKRDARELCDALDRYLRGNTGAFSIVRVPTVEQEQQRSIGRQRGRLLKERQRCVVRGHGLMLAQGIQAPPEWWRPRQWEGLREQLPPWVREQVADWQAQACRLDAEVERWSDRVEEQCRGPVPKGMGVLSTSLISMEVLDWSRFKNRRQVASYTGLCPSEASTGRKRRQGCINKHGNPRLRHQLVEAVWRLMVHQKQYPPVKKLLATPSGRARKRLAVAAARRLAIDLWRIQTGRCSAEKLGLKLR